MSISYSVSMKKCRLCGVQFEEYSVRSGIGNGEGFPIREIYVKLCQISI